MTIQQFIDSLGGPWHLDEDGNVMDDDDQCPLWHAYYDSPLFQFEETEEDAAEDYIDAGVRLGLRAKSAAAIAAAADNRGDPRLRKRLLKACGLT